MVLRLEVLALQKYIELIKKLVLLEEFEIKRETTKATVQKICSNFGEVKGLAAIMVSAIYSHSKAVLHWETMRKVLEDSLHHFEVLKQKYYPLEKGNTRTLKENTISSKEKVWLEEITLVTEDNKWETDLSVYPNCYSHKHALDKIKSQVLAGGNETVNPAEEMFICLSLANIKDACALVDSRAKEILSNCSASRTLSLKNEMLRTIEELESITTEMESIQVIIMTIKKYLDTGPYKTWEEVQVEFLQYLVQQPILHLYANQLSKSLVRFFDKKGLQITSLKRQKMMIEACLHPAITKLNANEISADILLELLPKFKDLTTLKMKTRITANQVMKNDDQVYACLFQYCSKLKCLCITFESCSIFAEKSRIQLDALLPFLPTTLISLSFYGIRGTLNVKFLDKMAASEKFNSLKRLTLSEASSNYPLHKSFKNLTAVAVYCTQFKESDLFRNIGGQLKELSLSCVVNIQIKILAECCPFLETLLLRYCTFSSSFHAEPLPTFSSLKEIIFITPTCFVRQESTAKNICIWCILRNSPEIEKLVIIISVGKFLTCFQKLIKANQMRHLKKFELYKRDKNIFEGLIKTDLAVQMINKFPSLRFIGGIDHAVTQRNLREIYSNKKFVCINEKTIQHVHEPQSEIDFYWEDSDIDMYDIF